MCMSLTHISLLLNSILSMSDSQSAKPASARGGVRGGESSGSEAKSASSSVSIKILTDFYNRESKGKDQEEFFLQFCFQIDGGKLFGCKFCKKNDMYALK